MSKEKRAELLRRDFEKLGLEMRTDSKLCNKFIESGFLSAYNSTLKIATRMAEMHYLYKYTNYSSILEEKVNLYNIKIKNGKVPYIKPQVESEYIALNGKDYPDKWPWMNTYQVVNNNLNITEFNYGIDNEMIS